MADDHVFLEIVANPNDANLDIVVVHGLNPIRKGSNAYTTWTAVKKKEERNWIKDKNFLRALLPSARIMIFGYNSHAVFGSANTNINDHTTNLLRKVHHKRRKDAPNRPLMFICHSLGGLLVKKALIVASLPASEYKSVYECTGGIVFFATPHGGSGKVPIGRIATSIARFLKVGKNNKFMETLSQNSICGEDTRKLFLEICSSIHLVSFGEGLPTSAGMVVDKVDAVCGLPDAREKKLYLNADHSGICKFFDPTGHDYSTVQDEIEELAEKIQTDATRWEETRQAPTPANTSRLGLVPYQTNTKFSGRSSEIESICRFFFNEPNTSQLRLILQGFPGIGKTSIAVEYALSQKLNYEETFWVTANSKEDVNERYEEFTKQIKNKTGQGFFDWCKNHRWLLVIDNLDDPANFKPASMIPHGPGHVLITTRRTDLGQFGTLQKVLPLDPQHATQLLLLYAEGRQPEEQEEMHASQICRMLGYVPLAIRHCGCYISGQQSRLSSYATDFDKLMTNLVLPEEAEDSFDTFNINEAKPILATFEVSFLQVWKVLPDAAALLEILANLNPTEISLSMLKRCLEAHKHWDESGNATIHHVKGMSSWMIELPKKVGGYGLAYAIEKLVTYSLIFPKAQEGSYFLHPLVHFFLRWRQDKDTHHRAFIDSSMCLLNGFPHPDFSRIYGLSHQYLELRNTFMPHVQHLNSRFAKLQPISDRELLSNFATLLLHASDVVNELRPRSKWRQVLPLADLDLNDAPEDIKAHTKVMDITVIERVQDVTLLPIVETIIRQLDYPAFLFLHAVYVFFHHISTTWLASHPRSTFGIENLVLAEKSIDFVRALALQKCSPDGPQTQYVLPLKDEILDHKIFTLMPLIYVASTWKNRAILKRESGMFGRIAIKFTLYIQEIICGSSLDVFKNSDGVLCVPMDNLIHLSIQIPYAWHLFNTRVIKPDTCDLYLFASSKLDVLACKPRKASDKFLLPPPDMHSRAITASSFLADLFSPESVQAAASLFMLISYGINITESSVRAALDAPVTEQNYFFKVALTKYWVHHLKATDKIQSIEGFLLHSLELFESSSEAVKGSWTFALDPILNIFELLIIMCQSWIPDKANAQACKIRYRDYFEERYGHNLIQRLALGCGVGVFGMSFGRLSLDMKLEPKLESQLHSRDPSEKHLEWELFDKIRRFLGPSGSSFPDGNKDVSEHIEENWCMFRLRKFIELRIANQVGFPFTTISDGQPGGWQYTQGISQDTYDAEELRLKFGTNHTKRPSKVPIPE